MVNSTLFIKPELSLAEWCVSLLRDPHLVFARNTRVLLLSRLHVVFALLAVSQLLMYFS